MNPLAEILGPIRDDAADWCRGRSWAVRVPLMLWFAYVLVRHLTDGEYRSVVAPLNLGIHEAGHLLFRWLGDFPGVAGGTLLQLAAPFIAMGMFYRQRDYFAVAFGFGWLSTNLFDVAVYAGDARRQALPLVSVGGGDVWHDWNYLLSVTGLLAMDGVLAFLFRVVAVAAMAVALGGGGWLLWCMSRGGAPKD